MTKDDHPPFRSAETHNEPSSDRRKHALRVTALGLLICIAYLACVALLMSPVFGLPRR